MGEYQLETPLHFWIMWGGLHVGDVEYLGLQAVGQHLVPQGDQALLRWTN